MCSKVHRIAFYALNAIYERNVIHSNKYNLKKHTITKTNLLSIIVLVYPATEKFCASLQINNKCCTRFNKVVAQSFQKIFKIFSTIPSFSRRKSWSFALILIFELRKKTF